MDDLFHQALHVIIAFGLVRGTNLNGTLPESGLHNEDETLAPAEACINTCVHALASRRTGCRQVLSSTLKPL